MYAYWYVLTMHLSFERMVFCIHRFIVFHFDDIARKAEKVVEVKIAQETDFDRVQENPNVFYNSAEAFRLSSWPSRN